MNWDDHCRWASKFGIDQKAAEYVNRIIDISDECRLPEEYKKEVADSAERIATNSGAKSGNSALSLVISKEVMEHDSGRRKTTRGTLAAECTLEHLSQKGDDFVDAWYLHHHLDYLSEHSTTGDSFEKVVNRYRSEYPEAHSQHVEEFLQKYANNLRAELGYIN